MPEESKAKRTNCNMNHTPRPSEGWAPPTGAEEAVGGAHRAAFPRLLLQAGSVSGEGTPERQVRDHPIVQRSPPSFQLRRTLPVSVANLPRVFSLLSPAPSLMNPPLSSNLMSTVHRRVPAVV